MAISISVLVLLLILAVVFLRSGGLKVSHALVCALLGFYLMRHEHRAHHPQRHDGDGRHRQQSAPLNRVAVSLLRTPRCRSGRGVRRRPKGG